MPSKKKKYNARFPAGRIKKIMQSDEEVGKVAQAVPVIISRTLELFVESLLTKTLRITNSRNAKTLSPSHMKQCIMAENRFDFLRELVKNIPDISVSEELDSLPGTPSIESPPQQEPYDLSKPSTSCRLNFSKFTTTTCTSATTTATATVTVTTRTSTTTINNNSSNGNSSSVVNTRNGGASSSSTSTSSSSSSTLCKNKKIIEILKFSTRMNSKKPRLLSTPTTTPSPSYLTPSTPSPSPTSVSFSTFLIDKPKEIPNSREELKRQWDSVNQMRNEISATDTTISGSSEVTTSLIPPQMDFYKDQQTCSGSDNENNDSSNDTDQNKINYLDYTNTVDCTTPPPPKVLRTESSSSSSNNMLKNKTIILLKHLKEYENLKPQSINNRSASKEEIQSTIMKSAAAVAAAAPPPSNIIKPIIEPAPIVDIDIYNKPIVKIDYSNINLHDNNHHYHTIHNNNSNLTDMKKLKKNHNDDPTTTTVNLSDMNFNPVINIDLSKMSTQSSATTTPIQYNLNDMTTITSESTPTTTVTSNKICSSLDLDEDYDDI